MIWTGLAVTGATTPGPQHMDLDDGLDIACDSGVTRAVQTTARTVIATCCEWSVSH